MLFALAGPLLLSSCFASTAESPRPPDEPDSAAKARSSGANPSTSETASSAQDAEPRISFTLPDEQGKPVRLPLESGQMTVLEFWAPSCDPCSDAIEALLPRRHQLEAAGARLVLIGVLPREMSTEEARATLSAWGFAEPFLIDREGVTRERLAVRALPATLVLDAKGIVRFAQARKGTADDVVRAVRELESGSNPSATP